MTIRAKLAAFTDAVNPPEGTNFPLSDAHGLELARELAPAELAMPAEVAAALAAVDAHGGMPSEPDAIIEWATQAKALRDNFWQAFEGQVVDGLRVIRRR